MRRSMVWREVWIPSRSVTRTPSLPPGALPRTCTICAQALRDSCKGIHKGRQALHKDFSETVGCLTKAFAHLHQQTNLPPATRQVGHLTHIAAMDPCGWFATERTTGKPVLKRQK